MSNASPSSRTARRLSCLFLLLVSAAGRIWALDPLKDLTQLGRQSWQSDSGLPQNTVHSIVQTQDGYIWLATEGGLVRFDGVQFTVYDKRNTPALPSNNLNSLFADRNGDLWISTNDGLVRRHNGNFTTFTTANGLPGNTVWSVFQSVPGEIWAVTAEGLAAFRDGSFHAVPETGGLSSTSTVLVANDGSLWMGTPSGVVTLRNGKAESADKSPLGLEVQAMARGADGQVWAGTRAGLRSFQNGKVANTLTQAQGLPASDVTALLAAKDGRLWIGTSSGLAVYTEGKLTAYTSRNGLPADRIESLYEDKEEAIWVSTRHGVARIFGGHIQAFTQRDGLSGNLVLSMFEDREGSLWLGTEAGGVDQLRDQKFTTYTTANGLSDDEVRSIFQTHDGSIGVGTNTGGIDRFTQGRFTDFTTANGLSSNIVLALGGDAEGDLWAGTPDGLNRIRNKGSQVFTSADGLADDFVRSIYAAADGSLWIGTRRGLSHFQRGAFTTYTRMDGLGSDLVGAIADDHTGGLWIGTLGGLSHLSAGKFTTLTTRDGLSGNAVTALYLDSEGALWIGVKGGSLNRLRDKKITMYPAAKSGLPEDVYSILEDARGNLWLSSNTGIYRVSKKELNGYAADPASVIHPSVYGTADGMKISECSSGGHPAAWKLKDGSMWFATLKGVAAIDPEHIALNTVPPPVAIEQISVDDKVLSEAKNLAISPGHSRLSFQYAGLSFAAPQKVRYRYKLEGFDKDWIDAGALRIASYTNLPPGKYRFRVLACNNDGVWNENGAAVDLRLKPHFYQTYWFYLAVALVLFLLGYEVYRWRLRQAELRFAAVLSERGRIAREIHDTLAQSLVGISVQLELVTRLLSSSAEAAKEHLDQARILVRNSLTEARSSIWDLRSHPAETEDLASRLSKMAAAATASTPIRVQSKMSGAYRPLAPKAEVELLRIAQEAVTNAVRHASPNRITIELRFDPHQLQMTIKDDGRGFNGRPHPQSSGPDGHFGLTGMRERAGLIGGTLVVDSAPGKGTEISVLVAIDG